ncbi:TetR/AcrR family transcriptional regulator [Tropicimonas sp. IMCC34011]|uniref:TetR/AcrR family transcriptional regulator n=1 Tax=Tropicimonas sp. IMCC34011 TaxID=2248759 RepID=UPI000E25EA41|nr:TetR/AcrR family transcriptional regulator [Tropicimonas sp. IMCC34011]
MNAPTGKIRRGRKYDQVIDGARRVFLRDGFEGASVDDIAREAGVSKATLYSYFPDKRLLFIEIGIGECQMQTADAMCEVDLSAAPGEVLTLAATRLVAFFTSPFGANLFRTCVAECQRFPELGNQFYASGPQRVRGILMEYIAAAEERGELLVEDHSLAADQFIELCKADLFSRLMAGLCTGFDEAERERVVNGAVEMFLARYGTAAKGS